MRYNWYMRNCTYLKHIVWKVLTCAYSHETITTIKVIGIFITSKVSSFPFVLFFFFLIFSFVVKTLNMKVSNMDHGVFKGWTIETCCRGKWRPHNKWPGPVDIKNYHYANDGIKLMCFFLVCLKKSCGLMRSIRQ